MFSRSKDNTPNEPASAPAPAPSGMMGKRSGGRSAPSIISADLVVHGTLISAGDVQIDGTVNGDVKSAALTIGDKAVIDGNIVAEDVTVRGRVNGTIRARKVSLASTCRVEGDILHEALSVEAGAYFEGNCRHADNPTADAAATLRVPTSPRQVMQPQQQPAPQPQPAMQAAPQSAAAASAAPLGPSIMSFGMSPKPKAG